MGKTVPLYVGDDYRVSGLLQGRFAHAGMPRPSSFSLVHKRDVGANCACNLFYSVEARDITVAAVPVHVESVTLNMITFLVGHR